MLGTRGGRSRNPDRIRLGPILGSREHKPTPFWLSTASILHPFPPPHISATHETLARVDFLTTLVLIILVLYCCCIPAVSKTPHEVKISKDSSPKYPGLVPLNLGVITTLDRFIPDPVIIAKRCHRTDNGLPLLNPSLKKEGIQLSNTTHHTMHNHCHSSAGFRHDVNHLFIL